MRQGNLGALELSTRLELQGDVARFIVDTDNAIYQERLVHMGFQRADAKSFMRDLSATPGIRRIHDNFSRHLEAMVLQSARLGSVPWDEALTEFLRRVEGSGLDWFLSGSGALAVRGLDVSPGDLDFVVADAQATGLLLDDLLVEPVTEMPGWMAKQSGRAFYGALIEWVAEVDPAVDQKPHEQGPAAASRLETVEWEGHTIRVTPIDLQLEVSELRGLDSRTATIRSWLHRRSPARTLAMTPLVEHSRPGRSEELTQLLRGSDWFMEVLRTAADVNAPDWWIGAGVLRDLVWDTRYGSGFEPHRVKDIDLAFFDPDNLAPQRDQEVEDALIARHPSVRWEAKNQAAVHVWYPRRFGLQVEPFRDTFDAVATWPEFATSVAVRLSVDDIEVAAPFGLDDLLDGIYRRNPSRVTKEEYERRLARKNPSRRWPQVRILDSAPEFKPPAD